MEHTYKDSIINLKFCKRRGGLFTCQVSTAVYKEKNRFPYRGKEITAYQTAKQYVFSPTIIKIYISIKILNKEYQSNNKLTIN
jgi:hypothetical protein